MNKLMNTILVYRQMTLFYNPYTGIEICNHLDVLLDFIKQFPDKEYELFFEYEFTNIKKHKYLHHKKKYKDYISLKFYRYAVSKLSNVIPVQ